MNGQNGYILLLFSLSILLAWLAYLGRMRRQTDGATGLTLLALTLALWLPLSGLGLLSRDLDGTIFWTQLQFISYTLAPVAWLIFALQYSGRGHWVNRRSMGVLFFLPVLTIGLAWTNEMHRFVWQDVILDTVGMFSGIVFIPGPAFYLYMLYACVLVVAAMAMLLQLAWRNINTNRRQSIVLLLTALLPLAGALVDVARIDPLDEILLFPLALAGSCVLMAVFLLRIGVLEIVPLTYDMVIENMPDGVAILDSEGHVLAVNHTLFTYLDLPPDTHWIGEPVDTVLPNILLKHLNQGTTIQTIHLHDRWMELRVSPLKSPRGQPKGQMMVLRDVTTARQSEIERRENERRFQGLFDRTNDAVVIFGLDGVIQMANQQAADMLNCTVEQLVGSQVTDHIAQDQVEDSEGRMAALMSGDHVPIYERIFRKRDGSEFPAEINIALVRDDDGKPDHLQSIVRDITARKAASEALRHSEARLRAILSGLPILLFMINEEGVFTLVEGRSQGFFKDRAGVPVGESAFDVFAEQTQMTDNLRRGLAGETLTDALKFNGQVYEVRYSPFYDDSGLQNGLIVILADITERRQIEEELDRRRTQFEIIFKSMPNAAVFTDPNRDVIMVNPAFTRQFGYTPDEIVGQSVRVLYADEADYEAQGNDRYNPDAEDDPTPYEVVYQRKDESTFISEAVGTSIRDNDGQVLGYLAIMRDITKRKEDQAALNERVRQLAILRQVDEEVSSTLDIEHVLMVALDAAHRLSEADAGFIALRDGDNMVVSKVIGQYTAKSMGATLNPSIGIAGRVIQTQEPELILDVHADPDYYPDLPKTCAEIVIPLLSQGRFIGLLNLEAFKPDRFNEDNFAFLQILASRIALAIDNAGLYEQTRVQLQETKKLYEQVSELEGLKTDMIRIASHDLRNPLGVMTGYLSMLKQDYDQFDEMHIMYFDAMGRSVKRMQDILQDILSLERIHQMAQSDATGRPFDLGKQVDKAVDEYTGQAMEKSQTLNIEKLTDEQLVVVGDASQLYEALANLISNAIKYTPEEGEIIVKLQTENGKATVSVQDSGYGIPKDQQEQLFQPFFRAESDETANISGTGLGLHLVKKIIERHHGEMTFESVYGKGSTFRFTLPLTNLEDFMAE